jgi:hypothetical protein
MRRYKEERRRQLAAHVATRLTSNASSSEEEEADRRSFTEFRSDQSFCLYLPVLFKIFRFRHLIAASLLILKGTTVDITKL